MALWNPQVVLDLHHSPTSFTCSGTTKKGLRCRQSMIPNADRSEAAAIMERISHFEPENLKSEVYQELAYLTLCPRWHRKPGYSQVSKVANQFHRSVQAFWSQQQIQQHVAGTGTPVNPPLQTITSTTAQVFGTVPQLQLIIPQPRLLLSTTTEAADDGVEAEIESVSATWSGLSSSPISAFSTSSSQSQHSPRQLPTPSTSASASRRGSDGNISPIELSGSAQNNQLQTLLTTPLTPSPSTTTPTSPLSPTTTVTHNSTHDHPPAPTLPGTASHNGTNIRQPTPRKSTDDDCPICYESLTAESSVYCRRQCGTNVHRDCFKSWRLEQVRKFDVENPLNGTETNGQLDAREDSRDAAVTCVYCRSPWMCEWD